MRTKNQIKTLLGLLLFISSLSINAAETVKKEVTLSEFLKEISSKHEVFFTYNPELVGTTNLNPKDYEFPLLDKIIDKLERKTSFDFEYLGNKYYVVYHKKAAKAEDFIEAARLRDEMMELKKML